MGIFGKLQFWKKNEPDLGLGSDLGPGKGTDPLNLNIGLEPMTDSFSTYQPPPFSGGGQPRESFSQPQFSPQQPFPQPQFQPQFQQPMGPSYPPAQSPEIVAAKLDTIKVMLDNINQRLANLERAIYENQRRW